MKRKIKIVVKSLIHILVFLMSSNGVAQKEKEDKYLDSIAKKIQFVKKEAVFRGGSLDALKEIISYIKDNNKYYLLECHTSREGLHEKNQILTEEIAVKIDRIMRNLGLDNSRFIVIGKGDRYPCCNTKTRYGRYLNRRVEIKEISEKELIKLKSSKQ
ncbi:OmpA-like domain-containing protein [Tenacibaculum sp. 190524A05c]|uniref:OmpA family protein n=1 Tax=Tenacibaculum platacis TaxID=3137852 RepID=UPI0031FADF94